MLRWLLPIIAAFALVGSSVTSWAAAGTIGDASCCCPIKAKCKCHDHGKGDPAPSLRRCAGEARLVAPAVAMAIPAVELIEFAEPPVTYAPVLAPLPLPDDISREPEKPPF